MLALAFVPLFCVAKNTTVYAEEDPTPSESESLSDAKLGYLSQYCETIKQNLKRLAVSDSKTRTYFGGVYEILSSKFITPLNVRLIKNDYSLSEFVELQSSFASSRSKFSADFIDYSKSLEELTVFDCKTNPGEFYSKLEKTRKKRESLRKDLKTLDSLLDAHVDLVKNLKGGLNENQ